MIKAITPAMIATAAPLAGEMADKPLITFNVNSQEQRIPFKLPNGLSGVAERDELGWVVSVFNGEHSDSLLYPQGRWHGAWPCHLYAWSHKSKIFPDIRIIPIRGYKLRLIVDLSDVQSAGGKDHEVFTSGKITLSLRHGA